MEWAPYIERPQTKHMVTAYKKRNAAAVEYRVHDNILYVFSMDFPEFSFGLGNEYDPVLRTSMIISNGCLSSRLKSRFK